MSNVIDFLEKLGQDSALRYASRAQLAAALSSEGFSPQLQAALLGVDQRAFERIVGADTNVCSMINVPDEEEEESVPHEPHSLQSLLGSDNVCCMVYAPTEESGDERAPQALSGSGNVCCMVFAPIEEQEQPQETRAAAA